MSKKKTKVYVISKDGKPLMPTCPAIARILLKKDKAKVDKKTPFTIKLKYNTSSFTQKLTYGVDTGSKKVGSAVVNENGEVVYSSEIELRQDVTRKMTRRRTYRRTRRNRKTRYRPARFNNRKNSTKKDRLPPTLKSKLQAHEREISFVRNLLPIAETIIEGGKFDPHAIKNPEVREKKELYQKGEQYGFENVKAFVRTRDNYICQKCKGRSKDERLEIHHIKFRRDGGSDRPDNLITLCKSCHSKLHNGEIRLTNYNKQNVGKGLKHASHMNIINKRLMEVHPEAKLTYGFVTKVDRWEQELPKEHWVDAAVIANKNQSTSVKFNLSTNLFKKCVSKGDYQQTKGRRSEKSIPTGKIHGFKKFDIVDYQGGEYIIKGRRSTGYFALMDIHGNKIDLGHIPKATGMERKSARKSCIMLEKNLETNLTLY